MDNKNNAYSKGILREDLWNIPFDFNGNIIQRQIIEISTEWIFNLLSNQLNTDQEIESQDHQSNGPITKIPHEAYW